MGRVGLRACSEDKALKVGLYPLLSKEETFSFGKNIATLLPKNAILALTGNLGAGKTTFVQGLAFGLGIKEQIQSPTFILLNVYDGLSHFDLYRLKGTSDFTSMGFEEHFHSGNICAIEWPERILEILPENTIHIHFEYEKEGRIAKVL